MLLLLQREELKFEEEDREDKDEEKPVVVVLKEGDLTAEEAERLQQTSTTQLDHEGIHYENKCLSVMGSIKLI